MQVESDLMLQTELSGMPSHTTHSRRTKYQFFHYIATQKSTQETCSKEYQREYRQILTRLPSSGTVQNLQVLLSHPSRRIHCRVLNLYVEFYYRLFYGGIPTKQV
jgi:hypothetical protein